MIFSDYCGTIAGVMLQSNVNMSAVLFRT